METATPIAAPAAVSSRRSTSTASVKVFSKVYIWPSINVMKKIIAAYDSCWT